MARREDDEDPYDPVETRTAVQDALDPPAPADDGGYAPPAVDDPGGEPPALNPGVTDPGARDPTPAAAAAPPPTAPAGTGSGIPWNPGEDHPSYNPPGYHWDATYARFVADAAPAGSTGTTTAAPSGGQLTDPAYAAQLVAYWGNQPGVNPSVKNDPNYWIGRFTSGAFGNDQEYAIRRMLQPEGAPEGSGAQAGRTGSTTGTINFGSGGGNTISAPQLPAFPNNDQFNSSIRNQILALLNQAPVDENDPDIHGAISANRVAQERSLAAERDQIAETNYAQHLGGSGAEGAMYQAARERTGASEGQFAGNAVAQQALARRNQITQILQIGAGVMTADQQQQLQRELANLDAMLRQQSITNQNNQTNDRLGFDIGAFQANMNRNAVLDAMGAHL